MTEQRGGGGNVGAVTSEQEDRRGKMLFASVVVAVVGVDRIKFGKLRVRCCSTLQLEDQVVGHRSDGERR